MLRSGRRVRPFVHNYHVRNKSYSRRLSKIIVDFAAESPFGQAAARIREHYDIVVPVSSVKVITDSIAKKAKRAVYTSKVFEDGQCNRCVCLISEVDGGMIPIVEPKTAARDKRKEKTLLWKELRIGVQQRDNETTWKYSVAYSIDDLEVQMRRMAHVLGVDESTKVHSVGDGAYWIKELSDRIYGNQASYLVDFFHMAEYLAGASEVCGEGAKEIWFTEARERMKAGKQDEIMEELATAYSIDPSHAGVAECLRYMQNRVGQFKYKETLSANLPIGSGKVESSHRTLVQSRLKAAGMWWRQENAENMACLRALRANNMWELLWRDHDMHKLNRLPTAA